MLRKYDLQLLDAAVIRVAQFDLGFAVRLLSISQASARKRIARLRETGLIDSKNVLAATPPRVEEPLCVWRPGGESPSPGAVSYAAKKRWSDLPVLLHTVYFATAAGRALLGREHIDPPKANQATHDLGLAEVFLWYRKRWPQLTSRCWLNESEYIHTRGRCVKVEDAMLARDAKVLRLIDYAGAYRPDRIQALLDHAEYFQVPIAIY